MLISNEEFKQISKSLGDIILNVSHFKSSKRHELFLLKGTTGTYILKSLKQGVNNDGKLKNEYNTLQVLPEGIGPKILYYMETSKTYLIESYIAGKYIENITCGDICSTSQKLKILHSQHVREDDFFVYDSAVSSIQENYGLYQRHGKKFNNRVKKALYSIYKYLEIRSDAVLKGRGVTLIHGDLNKENILNADENLFLIDWESARYDYPEIDLCSLIFYFTFSTKQVNYLLQEYGYFKIYKNLDDFYFFYIFHIFDILAYRLQENTEASQYLYIQNEIIKLLDIILGKKTLI